LNIAVWVDSKGLRGAGRLANALHSFNILNNFPTSDEHPFRSPQPSAPVAAGT
jgi:hypothetical protein